MTATVTNGKPHRKQLSDQLDRLDQQMERQDSILDALAEGLNQAVADAAKEGVKEAVKEAVTELLTNAALRAALHRATAPAPVRPTFWRLLKGRARRAGATLSEAARTVRRAGAEKTAALKAYATGASSPVRAAWRLRKAILVGVAVGAAVAGVSYAATHGVAAALSGVGAAATATAVQAGLWVRAAVRRLTPA
jgi:hypothetical protein